MELYQFIDHSCIEEDPDMLLDFTIVTFKNLARIKKAVPYDQRDHVTENDELAVYAIKRSDGEGKRRLTVWFNKEIAAIETSGGSVWGNWDEEEELLLTEDFVTAQDTDGSTLMGIRSYNIYGICGIYAAGRFFTPVDDGTLAET